MFKPVEGARYPVYSIGPKQATSRDVMFTCPVSAIPRPVFRLLDLWAQCNATKTLPFSGGFLEQPLSVRRCFPIFSSLWEGAHGSNQERRQVEMMAAMFGGKPTGK